MSSMLAVAVEHYLKSQNWHFQYDEAKNRFTLTMQLEKIESSKVYIIIGEDYILTYAMLPNHIPEGKRNLVCRFIARANYNMRNLYAKDRIPAQNEIERYIDISFLTLDRYAEGIMKILYADMDDKAAVEFVEK